MVTEKLKLVSFFLGLRPVEGKGGGPRILIDLNQNVNLIVNSVTISTFKYD